MLKRTLNYSRFISLLKIILPLIAIGLMATVFLFTKERTLDGGLQFSKADFVALQSGMQVTKPRFSGSNANGDIYDFTAEVLHPDAPKPTKVTATGLSGEIRLFDGQTIELAARNAEVDLKARTIRFDGGTTVVFSDGLRGESQQVFADLDTGQLNTDGPVTASSPMGKIEAGNLKTETIRQGEAEKRMIWFENGVKLVFNMTTPNDDKAGSE